MNLIHIGFFIFVIVLIFTLTYIKLQIVIKLLDEEKIKVLIIEIIPIIHYFKREYKYSIDIDYFHSIFPFLILKSENEDFKGAEIDEEKYAESLFDFIKNPKLLIRKIVFWEQKTSKYLFIFKFINFQKIHWKSHLGLNDPMYTAILGGALWGLKGALISQFIQRAKLDDFYIHVESDFDNTVVTSRIDCILKMRLVHIINICVRILLIKIRGSLDGIRTKRTEPSY